jgi:hypothetical protein
MESMRLLHAIALALLAGTLSRAGQVEEIRAVGGLPAHLAGPIDEISACHLSPEGDSLIFDRRAHAVYAAVPQRRSRSAERLLLRDRLARSVTPGCSLFPRLQ